MFIDGLFDELQQMGLDGGSGHRIKCFRVIFQATKEIVVGLLMSQELNHHATLLGRSEHENELIV